MLAWIEHHPGLAAWIQAVFSIIAIGVAVYVPWKLSKQLKCEEEERQALAEWKILSDSQILGNLFEKINENANIIRKSSAEDVVFREGHCFLKQKNIIINEFYFIKEYVADREFRLTTRKLFSNLLYNLKGYDNTLNDRKYYVNTKSKEELIKKIKFYITNSENISENIGKEILLV